MAKFYKGKVYKKNYSYSYALGPFPSIELIQTKPEVIDRVILSEEFNQKEELISLLKEKQLTYTFEEKTLERIGNRKKVYVATLFQKYTTEISQGNHLLLDQIDNMGNLGTIIRNMCAFGYYDLVLIGETCDYFDPKVIRASMGSIFKIRMEHFDCIEDYQNKFQRSVYAFMLDKKAKRLGEMSYDVPHTLAFGNEGAGLGDDYRRFQPVMIEQSDHVDSLNLTIACGIGMYKGRTFENNICI